MVKLVPGFIKRNTILSFVILAVIFGAGGVGAYKLLKPDDSRYVATAGKDKITSEEFVYFLETAKGDIIEKHLSEEERNNLTYETFKKLVIDGEPVEEYAKKKALSDAHAYKIQLDLVMKSGIKLEKADEDAAEGRLQRFIKESGFRTAEELDMVIKKSFGIDTTELKSIYRNAALIDKYIKLNSSKIKIPDEEVKSSYEKDRDAFDKVTIRHIVLNLKDVNGTPLPDGKQGEIMRKADALLERIRNGEDMIKLVEENSEDDTSKKSEGCYVFGKNDDYKKEFKEWAFKAAELESTIILTEHAVHVVRLEKRTGFEEVKSGVKETLQKKQYEKQLEELKSKPEYSLEINKDEYGKIKMAGER